MAFSRAVFILHVPAFAAIIRLTNTIGSGAMRIELNKTEAPSKGSQLNKPLVLQDASPYVLSLTINNIQERILIDSLVIKLSSLKYIPWSKGSQLNKRLVLQDASLYI